MGTEKLVFEGTSHLANVLHGLPHLNYKLKHINDTLFKLPPSEGIKSHHLEDYEYGQSLVVVGAFLVSLGGFICLIFAIFSCCWWQRRRKEDDSLQYVPLAAPKRHWLAVLGAILLIAIGFLGTGFSFNARKSIHNGVNNVKHQVDDVESLLNEGIDSGEMIRSNVVDTQTELNGLTIPPPFDDQLDLTDLNQMIDKTVRQIDSYLDDARAVEIPPGVNDSLTKFNNIYGALSIVMGLVAFAFLTTLCVRLFLNRNKRMVMCLSKWISVLLIFVVWAWLSISVVFAIAVADICVDPDNTTDQVLNEIDLDDFERQVFQFYVSCEDNVDNPLDVNLEMARSTIEMSQDIVGEALPLCLQLNLGVTCDQLQTIDTNLDTIDGEVMNLEDMLDCVRIHNDYAEIEHSLCHTILNSLGVSILCFAGAVAAAMISAFMCCDQKRDSAEEWKAMKFKSNTSSEFRNSHSQGLLSNGEQHDSQRAASPEVELNVDNDGVFSSRQGSAHVDTGDMISYTVRQSNDTSLPVLYS